MPQENKIELPMPDCSYADHSYPAYSKRAVIAIIEATKAIERERCAMICDSEFENLGKYDGSGADICAKEIRSLR